MNDTRQHFAVWRRVVRGSAAGMLVAVAAGLVATALGACQMHEEKPAVITTGVVNIGPAAAYPAGTANTSLLGRYGIVVVNDSGTPLAIRPDCTYAPAKVLWDSKSHEFVCPAHGCRYDLLGRPVKGPATRALPGVVAHREADGTLTVDLSRLYAQ